MFTSLPPPPPCFFKKEMSRSLRRANEDSSIYYNNTNSVFLLEMSNKIGNLYYLNRQDLCVLNQNKLHDIFKNIRYRSPDEFDFAEDDGENLNIEMVRISACEKFLAVVSPNTIQIAYLPEFLISDCPESNVTYVLDEEEEGRFSYLEWPPLNHAFLKNHYFLALTSERKLGIYSADIGQSQDFDANYQCATFSTDGLYIFAVNDRKELHILDPFTFQIIRRTKIYKLTGPHIKTISRLLQISKNMIVVGCVQDESEGEGEDLKPLVYLLTGDFFAQGAPITVKNLKMSDMGIRGYENDYSPASFKFLYIEARKLLLYSHSHCSFVCTVQIDPSGEITELPMLDLACFAQVRGFTYITIPLSEEEKYKRMNVEYGTEAINLPIQPRIVILDSEGQLHSYQFYDTKYSDREQHLLVDIIPLQSLAGDEIPVPIRIKSREISSETETFKFPNQFEETKYSGFNKGKKPRMMEDDEEYKVGFQPNTNQYQTESNSSLVDPTSNKILKYFPRVESKTRGFPTTHEQRTTKTIELNGSDENSVGSNQLASFSTETQESNGLTLNLIPERIALQDNGNKITNSSLAFSNIQNIPEKRSYNKPNQFISMISSHQSKPQNDLFTQKDEIVIGGTSNIHNNIFGSSDRTSSLFRIADFKKMEATIQRLEEKKNIFENFSYRCSKVTEQLDPATEDIISLVKEIEIHIKQYQSFNAENLKYSMLNNLSKTGAFMGNVLGDIIEELNEEKEIFIEDDQEDEDRITIQELTAECQKQMKLIEKEMKLLAKFMKNQRKIVTTLPEYKPRRVDYSPVNKKKLVYLRKKQDLPLKLPQDSDEVKKKEEEREILFRMQELSKLLLTEKLTLMEKMSAKIQTLRNKKLENANVIQNDKVIALEEKVSSSQVDGRNQANFFEGLLLEWSNKQKEKHEKSVGIEGCFTMRLPHPKNFVENLEQFEYKEENKPIDDPFKVTEHIADSSTSQERPSEALDLL